MKACKVQFKKLGKKYYFSCEGIDIHNKDAVVVNTIRGIELGFVCEDVFDLKQSDVTGELKEVIRKATKEDIKNYESNKALEPEILEETKKLAKQNELDMKVLGAEYTLDKSKLIVYFEAEERVDFRELVKELAEIYRTRIELRQVGSRDGAKFFGGIGPCGLVVCCQTFLVEFENVSVKMAKNQNLSLNPVKISGNCGKLLCCINYENDTYTKLRVNAPDVGDIVDTENGKAKVLSSDVLNRNLKVKYLDTEGFGFLKFEDVTFEKKKVNKNEGN
ncbi:MAG: stage 0 sporulation family protein [Anaeroplasmataceae bacterium]